MPWGPGKGVSWAVEYLRRVHGFSSREVYRQKLTRAANAGRIRARADWGIGDRKRPRWLFSEAALDEYAEQLRRDMRVSSAHGGSMTRSGMKLYSLTQAAAYVQDAGLTYSRASIQARAIRGELGQKIGNQWVFTESELQSLVERLRRKGP